MHTESYGSILQFVLHKTLIHVAIPLVCLWFITLVPVKKILIISYSWQKFNIAEHYEPNYCILYC